MGGLKLRTAGESHGPAVVAFLEGLPKGLPFDADWISHQLARRRRGYGRSGRQKLEDDRFEVLGGVRRGLTTGAPVALAVRNRDARLDELPELQRPRPGHADLAGCLRHGDCDIRSVLERASARETAARVAAGALTQVLLRRLGIEVLGHVVGIGRVELEGPPGRLLAERPIEDLRTSVEASRCGFAVEGPDRAARAEIDEAARERDSLGGRIEVLATGVPPGLGRLGDWEGRLDGRLAQALMSVPAIKEVAIGWGAEAGRMRGRDFHDPIRVAAGGLLDRGANRAGGLEGGLTNGAPLVLRLTMKPIATLRDGLETVDLAAGAPARADWERADVCAVPAAAVVAEAMVCFVLASACLELFGGADLDAVRRASASHRRRVRLLLAGRARRPGGPARDA